MRKAGFIPDLHLLLGRHAATLGTLIAGFDPGFTKRHLGCPIAIVALSAEPIRTVTVSRGTMIA
jgi:hypothetical protein